MRSCYLLTGDRNSPRARASQRVLEKVGFKVNFFQFIPHQNKVLSNKISFLKIYELILAGQEEWVYVFEDDVNVLADVTLDELVEYEKISSRLFYLGACIPTGEEEKRFLPESVNGHQVAVVQGGVRGAHAIAFSKLGVAEILAFTNSVQTDYCDVMLEEFTKLHPANVVRYDLESPDEKSHRGLFFQDRLSFPSSIG